MRCNITFFSCDAIVRLFFLVIWCHWHWHWHHMILMISSMVPLQSLDQDNQNEMQCDFFWSSDTIGASVIWHQEHFNDTTAFICAYTYIHITYRHACIDVHLPMHVHTYKHTVQMNISMCAYMHASIHVYVCIIKNASLSTKSLQTSVINEHTMPTTTTTTTNTTKINCDHISLAELNMTKITETKVSSAVVGLRCNK